MKKFLTVIGLILSIATVAYADFCCGGGKTKEQCCAEKGKMYCPKDNECRIRCQGVTPSACLGGCINPEGCVVRGVRVWKYVHRLTNAKKSWMGVIHV